MSTVENTLRMLKQGKVLSEELGLESIRIPVGPWPVGDTYGFQIALETLRASQKPGRHVKSYTQFDSVRKLRAVYINALETCPARCLDNRVFKSDKGPLFSLVIGSTNSKLLMMFMKGCEKRMGRLVKQDLGISFDMLMEVLRIYEEELMDVDVSDKCKWFIVLCSGTFVILWAGALRAGGEIFMLVASEFFRRRDDGRDREEDGHVIIPLMGRFKNETGEIKFVNGFG
jgi:hypothetical protein